MRLRRQVPAGIEIAAKERTASWRHSEERFYGTDGYTEKDFPGTITETGLGIGLGNVHFADKTSTVPVRTEGSTESTIGIGFEIDIVLPVEGEKAFQTAVLPDGGVRQGVEGTGG